MHLRLAVGASALLCASAFVPHARRAAGATGRGAAADGLEDVSYRDLQIQCKAAGLNAKGSANALRDRLREAPADEGAVGGGAVAQAEEPSAAAAEPPARGATFDLDDDAVLLRMLDPNNALFKGALFDDAPVAASSEAPFPEAPPSEAPPRASAPVPSSWSGGGGFDDGAPRASRSGAAKPGTVDDDADFLASFDSAGFLDEAPLFDGAPPSRGYAPASRLDDDDDTWDVGRTETSAALRAPPRPVRNAPASEDAWDNRWTDVERSLLLEGDVPETPPDAFASPRQTSNAPQRGRGNADVEAVRKSLYAACQLQRRDEPSVIARDVAAQWKSLQSAAEAVGEEFTLSDCRQVLHVARRCADCDLAVNVLAAVEESPRGEASASEWGLALGAFARARRQRDADRVAGDAYARGKLPIPDAPLARALLKAAVGASNWRKALVLLRDMEARSVTGDFSVTEDDWDCAVFAAERACVEAAKAQAGSTNSRPSRVDEATAAAPWAVLDEMKSFGHSPQPKAYVAVANAARHATKPEAALKALVALRGSLGSPEYQPIEGRPAYFQDAAIATLDALRRAALSLEPSDALSRSKAEKRRDMYAACAGKVLDDFLQDVDNDPTRRGDGDAGFPANDQRAFVTAATACARCLRPDAAVSVLRKCKRRAALGVGEWPTTQLYNVVLDAQASAGLNVPALLLLDEMAADSTLQLDAVTYNICLRVCVKSGDFRKAEKLLDEMEKLDRLRPDVVSFTTAIRSCCARRDVSESDAAADGADKRRPKNDAGSAQAALRLLDRAIAAKATNDVTFRTALRACVGAPSEPPRPAAFAALGLTVLQRLHGVGQSTLSLDSATKDRLRGAAKAANRLNPSELRAAKAFGLL
ncbi:hypothetical protein M885DRAFT_618227 [Pelagophyceae sp. CCMP2097]|nr:hypothetical protein M885DRAFT_618227 [Pelagophyceae sp. CCMP2097]